MARAPVPTIGYFRRVAVKPAAFEGIPDDVLVDMLEDNTDYVASFLGKHAKGQISSWDRSFQKAIVALTCLQAMGHRGYNKGQGADDTIVDNADRSEKWLVRVAQGEVETLYLDETPNDAEDGVDGGGSERSDDWVNGPRCGCGDVY